MLCCKFQYAYFGDTPFPTLCSANHLMSSVNFSSNSHSLKLANCLCLTFASSVCMAIMQSNIVTAQNSKLPIFSNTDQTNQDWSVTKPMRVGPIFRLFLLLHAHWTCWLTGLIWWPNLCIRPQIITLNFHVHSFSCYKKCLNIFIQKGNQQQISRPSPH